MFSPITRKIIKILQLMGCISCVIVNSLTDQRAKRIILKNRKLSREWDLLHYVTWSIEGSIFASITFGGFTFITFLLLITKCVNARSSPPLIERVLTAVGLFFFLATVGLILASLEYIQLEIRNYAITLCSLSFIVAFLFFIDLLDPMTRQASKYTQTENLNNSKQDVFYIQTKTVAKPQQPVFEKILMPEKKRPFKSTINIPKRLKNETSNINSNGQSQTSLSTII